MQRVLKMEILEKLERSLKSRRNGKAVVVKEDAGRMATVLRKMGLTLMELALQSMRAMLLSRSNSETSSCV